MSLEVGIPKSPVLAGLFSNAVLLTFRRYWRGMSPFILFFRPRSLPAG